MTGGMARGCLDLFSPCAFLSFTNLVKASLHGILYLKKAKEEAARILLALAQKWHSVTFATVCWSKQSTGPAQIQDGWKSTLPLDGRGNMQEQGSRNYGWLSLQTILFPFCALFPFSLNQCFLGHLPNKLLTLEFLSQDLNQEIFGEETEVNQEVN